MNWIFFYIVTFIFSLIFPMDDKKVCFLSDVRETMGGNLKFVYDYIQDKDYFCIVEFQNLKFEKKSLSKKINLAKTLVTSHYILLDDLSRAITFMKVRKNQQIVQLWHGPGAFKKIGHSRTNTHKFLPQFNAHRNYTKAIVTSKDIEWCYEEGFAMRNKGIVKATGYPRTDCFFDEKYIKNVKEDFYKKYPQLKSKKIILFAPTYRGKQMKDATYDFSKIDYQLLYDKFHNDYIFMLKWHPDIYNNINNGSIETPYLDKYGDFYQDFSSYRDINDLLLICDILITDYSSVIFDYVLLNKPIVYFTYDLEDYTGNNGRGLYYDFDDYVFGPIAKNSKELCDALMSSDLMEEKRKIFYHQFMEACDGHATQKTYEFIFNSKEIA
ncbi:MAG: CDP-glycerol glycerophosphotransferase family protein [Erysipelotrichaceae bacterium]|nr:CDP-glycerol glycerophosphotransferase family protein [Erysipelotrichaceae bacterium]